MHSNPHIRARSQIGYGLIELLVAMVIALFLLGGLFSILQSTRDTSTNQNLLAQLQDNQRIAMTLLTDVIEQAGYYPNAYNTALQSALPATGSWQAGQVVLGAANPSTTDTTLGDTVTVRYIPDSSNTILGCTGVADTANTTHTYQFSIAVVNGVKSLVCAVDGSTNQYVLAPNVSNLTIYYGTYSAGTTQLAAGTVDSYLTQTTINAATTPAPSVLWTNIYSVKVQLTFLNPLSGQPGQPATVQFTRVISLMSRTGVNISTES